MFCEFLMIDSKKQIIQKKEFIFPQKAKEDNV